MALPDTAQRNENGETRSPSGGSWPAKKCDINHTDSGRSNQRTSSSQVRHPAEDVDPGADDSHVEPGDGQQVHQSGLGKAILQTAVDSAPPAQNESIHHRGAGSIQRSTSPIDRSAESLCRKELPGHLLRADHDESSGGSTGHTGSWNPPAGYSGDAARRHFPTRRPAGNDRPVTVGVKRLQRQAAAGRVSRFEKSHEKAEPTCW